MRENVVACLTVSLLGVASPAFAQAQLAASTIEFSCEVSLRVSTAASSEKNANGEVHFGACTSSMECNKGQRCHFRPNGEGWCADEKPVTQPSPTAPTEAPGPSHCATENQCPPEQPCAEERCFSGKTLRPEKVSQPVRCANDGQCAAGDVCVSGFCALAPPQPVPSSALLRRGSELYLRDRAVQLREELALGEGPMIRALAAERGMSARALGGVLRKNRAELVALIGDGRSTQWPERFLERVATLDRARRLAARGDES